MPRAVARPLCQNGLVASYRDRRQPELLRFPGLWLTRILIGAGLFVIVLTAILSEWFDSPGAPASTLERAILFATALWLLACWPREIVCGPSGVEQRRLFGLGRLRIRWDEVQAISQRQEFGGLARLFGLAGGLVEVRARGRAVRHTPRHPDPERFLQECRMRIGEWQGRRGSGLPSPEPAAARMEKS